MSALTKLFVVLLVICSLLVSASVIVFVNRTEDFRAQATETKAKLDSAQAQLNDVTKELSVKDAALVQKQDELNGEITQLNQQKTQAAHDLAGRDATIADLQNKLAQTNADEARLTAALQSTADDNKAKDTLIVDLRKASDDLNRKMFDVNSALTEQTSKALALQKQLEYSEESKTDLQKEVEHLKQMVPNNGGQNAVGSALPPLTPVKGTVKAVNRFDGNVYATLDVGSSANVGKGMQFYAYNHDTGDFLGSITIDKVDPDESIGIIKGPRVNDVKQGTEVATQIQ